MRDNDFRSDQVRRLDRDRYVTALFAPDDGRRTDLLALYAFNIEVARTREVVSEPELGRIRLQWWRDVIAECYEGSPHEHFIVSPLAEVIRQRRLSRDLFDRLIDARERDLDQQPPETLEDLVHYARESSGSLVRLALETLGVREEAAQQTGEQIGTAWALTGMMRALPSRMVLGLPALPTEMLRKFGFEKGPAAGQKPSSELRDAVRKVCLCASGIIVKSRNAAPMIPREAISAFLLAPLAELYLRRLSRTEFDPFDRRNTPPLRLPVLRLMWCAIRGRY